MLFLSRMEGHGFFGVRLTRHQDYKKTLHAGELRPELANLLCCLSDPAQDDIFLDPFAGFGAIPIERANAFPYKRIYAGDILPGLVTELKQKAGKFGKRFMVGQWDGTKLDAFEKNSISKIVTDPPWGVYSSGENLDQLYSDMLKNLSRVLKSGGFLVLLSANRPLMDLCIPKFPELELKNKYNILVSGKKATVYKFVKRD